MGIFSRPGVAFVAGGLTGALAATGVFIVTGAPLPGSPREQPSVVVVRRAAAPAPAPPEGSPIPLPGSGSAPVDPPVVQPDPPAAPSPPPVDLYPEPSPLPRAEANPPGRLTIPVAGIGPDDLRDTFAERRGAREHQALDIPAPRGTPVVAVDDGTLCKLFTSDRGGLTLYQFDPEQKYCYYYAHLDNYAPGLREGKRIRRGDLLGYVGTSGNAPKDAPHLHFEVTEVGPDRSWSGGRRINPYPLLAGAGG
ncbi:MAG TPA: M23 family metallopeptidase [Armatimonadota bacterium]|nr:M23 family metallopeptidase [Armatimonadota bacterium]